MRQLFLIWILAIISLASQADNKEPTIITVPYYPTISDQITMQEEEMCEINATFAAKALQNAKEGVDLDTQLAVWDEFTNSERAEIYAPDQLDQLRQIIILAWDVQERYPDLHPNQLGDFVFESCAVEKLPDETVKF